ncbi:uncharacterized protein V6R79_017435 [Siganus canaliculatus]
MCGERSPLKYINAADSGAADQSRAAAGRTSKLHHGRSLVSRWGELFCCLSALLAMEQYNKQVVNKANAIISETALPHTLRFMCSHLLLSLTTAVKNRPKCSLPLLRRGPDDSIIQITMRRKAQFVFKSFVLADCSLPQFDLSQKENEKLA